MLPTLTIGPWSVETYSLFFALGALVGGVFYLRRQIALRHQVGRSARALVWIVLAGLVGANLAGGLSLAYELVLGHPFPVPLKNNSFLGALLGGGLASWFVCRHYGLSFWWACDQAIPALPLAQAIGRLGCLARGCCYGRPTGSWLGLSLPDNHGYWAVRYPTQLMAAALNLLIFFFLLAVERWTRKRGAEGQTWPFNGFLTLLYLGLYLILRFSLDFLRGDALPPLLGPLNSTQLACIGGLIFVLAVSGWRLKRAAA